MHVQVNSNHIPGSVELHEWVGTTVEDRLKRFDDFLTRVEVHISDENAQKAGADDKRCQIEARPKGLQPISVTHKAESLELAIDGAVDKLSNALAHQFGKLRSKRAGAQPQIIDGAVAGRDALLEEDFLADELVRNS